MVTEMDCRVSFASRGRIKATSETSRRLCKWVSRHAGSGRAFFLNGGEIKLKGIQQNYDRMDFYNCFTLLSGVFGGFYAV